MKKYPFVTSLVALMAASSLSAQEPEKKEYPSPNAIVDAAPASDWQAIAASDLLVMDLAPDAKGEARRVIIQLMPPPFSQGWIGNIRKLAAAKFWDGTSINRVQDNYVVQWGDAGYDNPESGETEQKALPEGLVEVPESEYSKTVRYITINGKTGSREPLIRTFSNQDAYTPETGYFSGWRIAMNNQVVGKEANRIKFNQTDMDTAWPVHCYGAVGVGRNLSPNTGTGAELYTVIGHAPRHLDRNIAVVGRIVEGIEHLSSLPRGKGQLGFYTDPKKRVPIRSIRLGTALPDAEQPRFEYLDTASKAFAQYADARANRRDPFFIKPAGGADICNIPVPVRRVKAD
ncbi:peptidylprolyl isomerase [Sphingorhabdus sp. EL138]|uniref:peptidylprolyl isomerase n=1 Tax=Sphingorhabdus sp. EL138 TaxID=2073156 RepID=UPI000D68E8EB|nr:peptidylprolyl isomerase [Sphingorhabdus sp. EL138]